LRGNIPGDIAKMSFSVGLRNGVETSRVGTGFGVEIGWANLIGEAGRGNSLKGVCVISEIAIACELLSARGLSLSITLEISQD